MRRQRLLLVAALAIAGLTALQSAGGCSASTPKWVDGGNNYPDAGALRTGVTGSACAADQTYLPGTCSDGYFCRTDYPGGYCVKSCISDEACGQGNRCTDAQPGTCPDGSTCWSDADCGDGGACGGVTEGTCLKGCDATVDGGSGCRAQYVCAADGEGQGTCIPDCRVYSTLCSPAVPCDWATGRCGGQPDGGSTAGAYQSCATEACAPGLDPIGTKDDKSDCLCYPDCSNGDPCPGRDHCEMSFGSGQGRACLPDCTQGQACPDGTGWVCQSDGDHKTCLPPGTQQPYAPCGPSFGACVPGAVCLTPQAGLTGLCVQGPCTDDSQCTEPPGARCDLPIIDQNTGGMYTMCAVPCSGPNALVCPAGNTTCQAIAGSGSVCL